MLVKEFGVRHISTGDALRKHVKAGTVRARPGGGGLSVISVSHSKLVGVPIFVWVHRLWVHNSPTWCMASGWSEKDAALAEKLGQLQPLTAVFPQESMGRLPSSGPT